MQLALIPTNDLACLIQLLKELEQTLPHEDECGAREDNNMDHCTCRVRKTGNAAHHLEMLMDREQQGSYSNFVRGRRN